MSNFSFLEYSFNPLITEPEYIYGLLNRLGFVQRNKHQSGVFTMWTQNQCIILLRNTHEVDQPRISGLGIMLDESDIDEFDVVYDHDCSMNVIHDPQGLRILAMPEKQLAKMIVHGYETIDKKLYDTPGLEYFSGVVYNIDCNDTVKFYQKLGFNYTKSFNEYDVLMSKNNRFTLLCNNTINEKTIGAVYTDTNDVFRSTCHFVAANFNIKEYNLTDVPMDFGIDLNYKIFGYNCIAFGDQKRYTIENSILGALPNIDIVFRTRKQFLHISEESIKAHYAIS